MESLHVNDKAKVLGTKGEQFVHQLLIGRGYISYKANMRKWTFEIDLIMYRLIPNQKVLEVRAVEVKTRSFEGEVSLADFKLEQKLLRYRYAMFNIGQEIYQHLMDKGHIKAGEGWYFKYHLDLAVVGRRKILYLQKYIQNVNLLI